MIDRVIRWRELYVTVNFGLTIRLSDTLFETYDGFCDEFNDGSVIRVYDTYELTLDVD